MSDLSPAVHHHSSVVLFYKYFLPSTYPLLHKYPHFYEEELLRYQKDLCCRLGLKGRLLIAAEGINGTLSAVSPSVLEDYRKQLEEFELIRDCGFPSGSEEEEDGNQDRTIQEPQHFLFSDIDWKTSTSNEDILEPFPDLKVTIVKEIISSGNAVSAEDIANYGGQHLEPKEFHETLMAHPDAILIDVRNTFEYDVGHFVNPNTNQAAMNPSMVTFSSFDTTFCSNNAPNLSDKKCLLYCTGGIRCEKASAMLKRRGVKDVYQLKGGIHRYLEEYGDEGCFKGLNFVFDQRVAMTPSQCKADNINQRNESSRDIVGKCIECNAPFDEICGSRVCTVCRDLVLVCSNCQKNLREYHCRRHAELKHCYFTFLEVFDRDELQSQKEQLMNLRETYTPPSRHKNVRRTMSRQVEKILKRIEDLESGLTTVDPSAPRRCRTCSEPLSVCDGRCWGFWRTQQDAAKRKVNRAANEADDSPLEISVGDVVEPGPQWHKPEADKPRRGVVVDVKSWGTGGVEKDAVSVCWNEASAENSKRAQSEIYRWGVKALNGMRLYDLRKAEKQ